MREPRPVGLVIAGMLADSTLARVPALSGCVDLVAASSRRLASRYANALRVGSAVGSVRELGACRMLWIQVPAPLLAETLLGLIRNQPRWKGRAAVLLDAQLDSAALGPLASRGAAVASLAHVPDGTEATVLAEGDAAALRALSHLLGQAHVRGLMLKPGSKLLYTAGLLTASTLTAPVADAAMRCLRGAGIDQLTTKKIVGRLMEAALRDQQAHGRKAWVNPAAGPRREVVLRQMEALRALDPLLAKYVQDALRTALESFGKATGWLHSASH
jgi:hypothetical protein